jgi:hypothetical protein
MKPHLLTLAAIGAFAVLVVTVVVVGVSSASGTPGGGLAASSPRAGLPVRGLEPPACLLPSAGGPSSITATGVCKGKLQGEFRCVRSEDVLAVSIRRPLGGQNVLYLTILVPDYIAPGGYPESEGFMQIIGPADPPRWTTRDAITRVDPDGSLEVGTFLFKPEPGTPATGKILLRGHAVCARPDRGVVTVARR